MTEVSKLDYSILCIIEAYPEVTAFEIWKVINWAPTVFVSLEAIEKQILWLRTLGFIFRTGNKYQILHQSWRDHVRVKLGWFERATLAIGAGVKTMFRMIGGKANG